MRYYLIFLLCIFSVTANGQNQAISKVEPENWWLGMENQSLQILLYGDNITHLRPKINHLGVTINKTVTVENPNYLFLYLTVGDDTSVGDMVIDFYNQDKKVQSINYPLLARTENSSNREGFNSSDVMYLITPDRFANGAPENDNMNNMLEQANRADKSGRHGGDIAGIHQQLDYIDEMGFTSIWLNPVLENNMAKYSYHGYAATDLYKVDSRFGSNEEYKAFITAAGKRDIKVIMDMILNHVGTEHWFVKDAPTADWVNFAGEYSRTSHRRNTIQDLYASEYDKKQFSDGWFVATMPDLNQRNALLADYLIQNSIWWIEYSGLAGIRMDTYPYPDKDFMNRWTCEIMQEYPDFNIVGEEWVTDPAIVSYWQADKVNHDGYTSCLRSLMDFPIQHALVEGLATEEKTYNSGLIKTYEMLAKDFLYADPTELVTFPDNHDMNRFFTQVDQDIDLFHMGINYILTMRGVPQIYYGTEVLMHNDKVKRDHGEIRADFPGGWSGDQVNAFTGKGLTREQKSAQEQLRTLLNWRKDKTVIHDGKLMQFTAEDGVYVFFRYNDKEKVMIVMNKNQQAYHLDLTRFNEMLDDKSMATEVLTGKKHSLGKALPLIAKTTHIFELN